jgi:DNA polymerase (family X)
MAGRTIMEQNELIQWQTTKKYRPMINNASLAKALKLTANLLELHKGNPFKVKSYHNAYGSVKKWPEEIQRLSPEQIERIPGIGKGLKNNILSYLKDETFDELAHLMEKTPPGVIDLLAIPGLGPKKVEIIWKEMGIENPGSLLYACNENRLIEYKGFGAKTQATLIEKIQYYFSNQGKMLYPQALQYISTLVETLNANHSDQLFFPCGEIFHKNQIVQEFGVASLLPFEQIILSEDLKLEKIGDRSCITKEGLPPVEITCLNENTKEDELKTKIFHISADLSPYCGNSTLFVQNLSTTKNMAHSFETFVGHKVPAEFPELGNTYCNHYTIEQLIQRKDIKGLIHLHTQYSDGINTLEEMAESAIMEGFEYMLVTDHSKFAFYANGLNEERLLTQMEHIERLNAKLGPSFKILKGIECDILPNGNLDLNNEILALLDLVIVSVHSHLNMEEETATQRIIKAIENPNAHILGHSCGRVLLSRKGYSLNYPKIFKACSENRVSIELNANPQRLDLDHSLIQKAMDYGIKISINPDAHNKHSVRDIEYGITAARKGGLTRDQCLNTMNSQELLHFFGKF